MIAIIVPADGSKPLMVRDAIPAGADAAAKALRAKVGGPLMRLAISGDRDMWVNAEGETDGLPLNVVATALAFFSRSLMPNEKIHGDVVILGRGDTYTGLTADQVRDTWRELGAPVAEQVRILANG